MGHRLCAQLPTSCSQLIWITWARWTCQGIARNLVIADIHITDFNTCWPFLLKTSAIISSGSKLENQFKYFASNNNNNFLNNNNNFLKVITFICVYVCTCLYTCHCTQWWDQRIMWERSVLSFCYVIELKSSDLAAAILYADPGSHFFFFCKTGLSLCNPAYLELTEILMSQLPNC